MTFLTRLTAYYRTVPHGKDYVTVDYNTLLTWLYRKCYR